ncbi:MAG: oligopeptide transporter, OPT family [Planctomycetes bacterium]|nr:oligopeptide transporter, OPT family [Planctomycetota bacterium]
MTAERLSPTAYELKEGQEYVPLISQGSGPPIPEITIKAVLSGILLGILFGAANTYLGLKAGLTISTSIPVAVLTVVVFRALGLFGRTHTILEANMSQTIGSASSSVASGVLFTIPALFMWGLTPAWRQLTLLAMSGGLIGVLAMIPLRRYLIRREHGKLPYPEGLACAEVLVAARAGSRQASAVFWGLGIGIFFMILTDGLKVVAGKFKLALPFKAELAASVSPALVGVGYILGIRVASVMVAGGLISALILIPGIHLWGAERTLPVFPEQELLIGEMSTHQIWNRYVRYIGAGAVAMAGILTLIRSIPTMVESFRLGLSHIKSTAAAAVDRADLDLSFRTVIAFIVAIVLVLTFVPGILGYIDSPAVRGFAAVLAVVFAFFFVTVSSRIVGLVGVTSNPTSGMTIATLLGTSTIFLMMGWTDTLGKATALMVGTVVCIAASIAGDTSQDLKTGFLLGATPRLQQVGELVGVITSAGFVCLVVMLLNDNVAGGLGGEELPAPQSVLMKLVIDGVLEQNLPWLLIFIGAGIVAVAALFKLPTLAFAVGIYLPLSTMGAVFLGGLTRHLVTRRETTDESNRRREQGVLFGSGLVGGGGLAGVLLALWVALRGGEKIEGLRLGLSQPLEMGVALAAIAVLLALLRGMAVRRVD